MTDSQVWYLTEELLNQINNLVVHFFGGEKGVKNEANIYFIAERVKTLHEGLEEKQKILAKAAFYLVQIVRERHPFTDGNKRTGIIATELFLFSNGFKLKHSQEEKEKFLLELAYKKKSFKQTISWIKEGLAELTKGEELEVFRGWNADKTSQRKMVVK